MRKSFEDLFNKHQVDLVVNGHVHGMSFSSFSGFFFLLSIDLPLSFLSAAYERTKPVFNEKVVENGTVYVTNGIGGTGEGLAKNWYDPEPEWSVTR
jgi:predicted MPP superfamily phosphohydrolase